MESIRGWGGFFALSVRDGAVTAGVAENCTAAFPRCYGSAQPPALVQTPFERRRARVTPQVPLPQDRLRHLKMVSVVAVVDADTGGWNADGVGWAAIAG